MGVSLTRSAWHGAGGQHDHPCPGDFTSLDFRSIATYRGNADTCNTFDPADILQPFLLQPCAKILPSLLRASSIETCIAIHLMLRRRSESCEQRCIAVQVPASCTLPAAPPWPEEATHPLAPLPTVRQANGVETTRGTFYEVCPSSHSSQIEGIVGP